MKYGENLRNATVKYTGAVLASMGILVLAAIGAAFAWSQARSQLAFEFGDVALYVLAGAVMLVAGVGLYWGVGE